MQYIDPEFYAHNIGLIEMLNKHLPNGVKNLSATIDQDIISRWCRYHSYSTEQIAKWFVV